MKNKITAACVCNTGKRRNNNEDNFYFNNIVLPEENDGTEHSLVFEQKLENAPLIFGVFDGMGGASDGQVAAFLSANILSEEIKKNVTLHPKKFLDKIILLMNDCVCEEAKVRFNDMGCTAAILYFIENAVYVCNVGDSRIYRLHNEKIEQLSEDHTDAEILAKQGIKNRKPCLTQCIGISPEEMLIEPYIRKDCIESGERYLICSDGLTDMVSLEEIKKTMMTSVDVAKCTEELVTKALNAGGRDNITVIVIQVGDFLVSQCLEKEKIVDDVKIPERVFCNIKSEKQINYVSEEQKNVEEATVCLQTIPAQYERKTRFGFLKAGLFLLLLISCLFGVFFTIRHNKKHENKHYVDRLYRDVEERLDEDLEEHTISTNNLILEATPFEGSYQGENE